MQTPERHFSGWIIGNVTEGNDRHEIAAHLEDGSLHVLSGKEGAIRLIGKDLLFGDRGGQLRPDESGGTVPTFGSD